MYFVVNVMVPGQLFLYFDTLHSHRVIMLLVMMAAVSLTSCSFTTQMNIWPTPLSPKTYLF